MAAISAAFVDRMETTPKATDIYSFDKNTYFKVSNNRACIFTNFSQIKIVILISCRAIKLIPKVLNSFTISFTTSNCPSLLDFL